VNTKAAIIEIYPQIPWELVVDPLGPAEHILGTTVLYVSGPHLHKQLINIIFTFKPKSIKWFLPCKFCDSCVYSLFFVLTL
jgi:hypothetical protein